MTTERRRSLATWAERAQERTHARQEREKAWLALALAWVAGFVDAVGYLVLVHLFTAHMSGNSVAMGAYLGQGDWHLALRRGYPVPLYVVGIAIGTLMLELITRRHGRRKVSRVLLPEVALLLIAVFYGRTLLRGGAIQVSATWQFYLLVTLMVLAMGLQTAALRRVGGQTIRTTYVTGMLTNLAEEAVNYAFWLRDHTCRWAPRRLWVCVRASHHQTSFTRATLLTSIWLAYAIGAVSGGFFELRWGLDSLALPLVLLAAVIATDLVRPIREP